MFGVGLHFDFGELLASRRVAVPAAVIQSLITIGVVTLAGHLAMGWTVVEDVFTVAVLIVLPMLAAPSLDLHYVFTHPIGFLLRLGLFSFQPLVILLLTLSFRQSLHTSLVVAIGLGQVGEFSFILIQQAAHLNLLPGDSGYQLVAATIISIALNPFLFGYVPGIGRKLRRLPWLKRA